MDPLLQASHISVGYRNNIGINLLLEDISLEAEKGELIALSGLNGTGKSSLLKSILLLEQLLEGDIYLSGKRISGFSATELARIISFVSTDLSGSLNIRVSELVSLGRFPYTNIFGRLNREDQEKTGMAIHKMKLEKLADRKISEISDGEKQRTMIARAIAQDTDLILLDEPTAFLDIPNKYEILGHLHSLCSEGKTIIFSTHDIQLASRFADRIWLIDEKKLVKGSPEDLVLSGMIHKAFASEKLEFDYTNGDFKPYYPRTRSISMEYNRELRNAAIWTERALNRIGYMRDKRPGKGVPHLLITQENEEIIWKLQFDNQNLLYKNLLGLVNYLKIKNYEFS